MPEHVYTGLTGHVYPESRDASGAWIGEVEPGDIRDLSEPLDDRWREATDEDRAAIPGLAEVRQRARDEDRFYRLVRQLGEMGLSAAIREQLMQGGSALGLPAAEGLVSGGMVAVQQANRGQAAAAGGNAAPRPARARAPRAGDQTGTEAGKTGSEKE